MLALACALLTGTCSRQATEETVLELPVWSSPVRLCAMVHRSEFTEAEWDLLVERYHLIFGLSNHGYDFPGSIGAYRSKGGAAQVLAYVEATGIQPDNVFDDRFAAFDLQEDAFFHTADPASLRVLGTAGGNQVFFYRDARAIMLVSFYDPPGVLDYLVEWSDQLGGPFAPLGASIPEYGQSYYSALDSTGGPDRYYRVRTRLADGTVVPYSWAARPEPASSAIALGWIQGPSFHAVLHASALPAGLPEEVVLEVDGDADRVFGEPGEQFAAATLWSIGQDLYELTGSVPEPFSSFPRAYRFALQSDATVTAPADGASYSHNRYNNRLVSAMFGAHQLKPGHELVAATHIQRMNAALATGYDGLHLDFVYDTLAPTWISYADAAPQEQAEMGQYVESMSSMIDQVQSNQPAVPVAINGMLVPENAESYFDYLEFVSGGDIEYFAFGEHPGATEISDSSLAAVAGMWKTAHEEGKIATAIVGSNPTNTVARLKALALYLLVARENAYFCFVTDLAAWPVEYYPEWDVPLGAPVLEVLADLDLLADPRGPALLSREFENGWVFFNWDSTSVDIELGAIHFQLEVEGGPDPLAGGAGAAIYTPRTHLTIEPGDGAIVVAQPPTP